MDPSSKTTPGFELPSPGVEQGPPAGISGSSAVPEQAPLAPEQAPAGAERSPVLQPAAIAPPLSAVVPQTQPAAQPVSDDVTATTQTTNLTVDEKTDLIDKTWVEKAKQIVERTRDDPYKQSEELTIFKADYMKKRYGKTIKVS